MQLNKKSKKKLTIILLLWGLLWACICVLPRIQMTEAELAEIDWFYMSLRVQNLIDSMRTLADGGTIIPNADANIGYYIYNSVLGLFASFITGRSNPPHPYYIIIFNQIGIAFLTFSVYPLLMWLVSSSKVVGFATPFLFHFLLGHYLYIRKSDVYWAAAWIIIVSIPLLLLIYKRKWDKYSWFYFACICLCMSVANIFRPHCALAILVLLFVVVCIKLRQADEHNQTRICKTAQKYWKQLLIIFICAIFSYTLLFSIVPNLYVAISQSARNANSGTSWHILYIGIGWEENPWGIVYRDADGSRLIEILAPHISFGTTEYGELLRGEYLRLFAERPLWMIGSYIRKFINCLYIVFTNEQYPPTAVAFTVGQYVVVIASLITIWKLRIKRILFRYAHIWFFLLVCFPFTLLEGMMAVPRAHYLAGAMAVYEWLLLLPAVTAVHMIGEKLAVDRNATGAKHLSKPRMDCEAFSASTYSLPSK